MSFVIPKSKTDFSLRKKRKDRFNLTNEQVNFIRTSQFSDESLAAKYNCSTHYILSIRKNKVPKHYDPDYIPPVKTKKTEPISNKDSISFLNNIIMNWSK